MAGRPSTEAIPNLRIPGRQFSTRPLVYFIRLLSGELIDCSFPETRDVFYPELQLRVVACWYCGTFYGGASISVTLCGTGSCAP
jgi:hypothetical protein